MLYVKGNLVEALKAGSVDVIAHQSNCFNTMGSGVALAIKEAFPEAYAADCNTIKGDKAKLGTHSMAVTKYGHVFNLYGQYNYGKDGAHYTDYLALEYALDSMVEQLMQHSMLGCKIGLPKIGAGTGGGNWNIIKGILEDTLTNFEVLIYEL
jgi:O-acetyl-ADP-ribose deacetylase (regulator of RNase III)